MSTNQLLAGYLVAARGVRTDWQEAQRRFSEPSRSMEADGPQFVTRHGEKVAVIIDIAEYRCLQGGRMDFKKFLRSAPDFDVEITRLSEPARVIDLSDDG